MPLRMQTDSESQILADLLDGQSGHGAALSTLVVTAGVDTLAPAAPSSVSVSSASYSGQGGVQGAEAIISWSAVTTNSDGSTCTDLDGYLVSYKNHAASDWSGEQYIPAGTTVVGVPGFALGQVIDARVRAQDKAKPPNRSPYTTSLNNALTTDTTAPNQPSTPTVTGVLAGIRVVWNGKDSAGAAMPADFGHYEVHQSTTTGFTPSAATLVDSLPTAGGASTIPLNDYGTTHYVKIIAYDLTGNASTPSAQASAAPTQAVDADLLTATITNRVMGANSVATANIQNAAITTALIGNLQVVTAAMANLAVTDAKIGDCSITKLTVGTLAVDMTVSARIKTANSGQRSEMDAHGFHVYNSSNVEVCTLGDVAGTLKLSVIGGTITGGTIQTNTSGQRIVLNGSTNTIDLYNSLGTNVGSIRAQASPDEILIEAGGNTISVGSGGGGIANTGGGTPTWSCGGMSSAGPVNPTLDNTYALGSVSFRWASINVNTLGASGSVSMSGLTVATVAVAAGFGGSANTTLLRASSSERYKQQIDYDEQPDYTILDLRPVTYADRYEEHAGKRFHGLIAEDVAETHPLLVVYDDDGKPDSLMYDRITPLLLHVVRDINDRLTRLEGVA